MRSALDRLRNHARAILRAAVEAVEPSQLIRAAHARGVVNRLGDEPICVVSAGKAAWPMARAFVHLMPERARDVVVAGPAKAPEAADSNWRVYSCGHPLPNDRSVAAGADALATARRTEEAWLVVLLSGGASAMLAAPAPPLTLLDKIAVTGALLEAGVPIDQMNCVRKHVSSVKGGRLGAAANRSLTLALSDVHAPVADDPSIIGSGPTVGDASTFAQALEIARGVAGIPRQVCEYLERGAAGECSETIKPGDPRLKQAFFEIVGNRQTAIGGAARAAASLGYSVELIDPPTGGEAREASRHFVARAHAIANVASRPLCIVGAGETTVHVVAQGKGGRNQEFALAGTPFVARIGRAAVLASAGTDGVDGSTDAAGALVDSSTLQRSQRAGLDWQAALAENDAYNFFGPLGDLIHWGPTGTNVGDVQILLIA